TKKWTHQQCEEDLKVAHGRVWRWRQQQWEAVQGPMRDSGLGSSMRRRYIGAHGRLGAWQQLWEARNLPAPYEKNGTHQQLCEET
ncbi:unnamed protein product, partial [Staurois parvus]